jgi:hypothetical protein
MENASRKSGDAKRTWMNVYVLRQEYNGDAGKWLPVIFYWNCDGTRWWVECLCTETGSSYYYSAPGSDYARISRPGTDRCDPVDVRNMVAQYRADCAGYDGCGQVSEVRKLGSYAPRNG